MVRTGIVRDVMQIDISTGFLVKQIQKVSAVLKSPYEELEELLKQQRHLHIDETSFKKNGKLQWAWCFVSEFFSFFKIDASRGSKPIATLSSDSSSAMRLSFQSMREYYALSPVEGISCY